MTTKMLVPPVLHTCTIIPVVIVDICTCCTQVKQNSQEIIKGDINIKASA